MASEAIKGEGKVQHLGGKYGVHPAVITRWKEGLLDNAPEVFGKGTKTEKNAQDQVKEPYSQIGQLKAKKHEYWRSDLDLRLF